MQFYGWTKGNYYKASWRLAAYLQELGVLLT